MYLFKNHEHGSSKRSFALPGGSTVTLKDTARLLLESLTGEEKPGRMLLELSILVLLLHAWALAYLLSPVEPPATPAQPFIMQVSLIAAPSPKHQTATPQQAPQPPPAPRKPKQKPLAPKKPTAVRKADVVRQPKPVPQTTSSDAGFDSAPVPATTSETDVSAIQTPAPKSETFTEANYRANYGFNPKPNYPRIARSRGWQGKVLLRVQVSAAGVSDSIFVHKSSGHEILDASAIEAVKQWRFIPARRGDTPVASSVVVPILFTLQN